MSLHHINTRTEGTATPASARRWMGMVALEYGMIGMCLGMAACVAALILLELVGL